MSASAHDPVAHGEVDGEDVLLGLQGTADPQLDSLRVGGDDAGGDDDVLCLERRHQGGGGEPVAGQLRGREFDVDALGLCADQVHLGHVGHLQQPRADILHVVAQLATGEPIRGESIDDAVGVAELVVADRTDHALRQRQLDVLHLLAHLVPGIRHRLRPGRSLEIHEDRRLARLGVALQVVEVRRLLQLALDALGDLEQRVLQRRARPLRLHHHRLDGEGGVLVAPQPHVGGDAEDDERQHQVVNDGSVAERPGGEVEAVHGDRSMQANLLTGPQRMHAGGHHHFAAFEPAA